MRKKELAPRPDAVGCTFDMGERSTAGGRGFWASFALLAILASRAWSSLFPCEHWADVLPDVHPEPRYGAGMVWDGDRHVAILFGGAGPQDAFGAQPVYNDVWEFQPMDGTWSKVDVSGPSPPARFHHGMAYDSARKRVVVFGGQYTAAGNVVDFFRDTWEYDPAARTWASLLQSPPSDRAGAALAYDAVRHRTVLFGGFNHGPHYFDTTWEWDGTAWTQAAPAHFPAARAFHAMAWDAALGKVVLYGGVADTDQQFKVLYDDTWTWDGSDWTQLATAPLGCDGHAMAYDATRQQLLVFGGCGDNTLGDETFLLESPYAAWQLVRRNEAPARTLGAMVVSNAGEAILFGGRAGATILGDTWVLKGFPPEIGTQPLDRASGPCLQNQLHVVATTDGNGVGPFTYRWRKYLPNGFTQIDDGFRFSGATTDTLVIDPLRPEDVGNYSAIVGNACGETESATARIDLADGHWTASGQLPSARYLLSLAYDGARQRMVSFGGLQLHDDASLLVLGDTIERDGIAWEEVAASGPSPSPRYGYALAYDAARGVTVLHGGRTFDAAFNFTDFGDTWEWDGTAWSLRTTAGPSARFSHAMVYDSARQRVVLFGGQHNGGFYGDLWEWDGTTWSPRGTSGDPTYGSPVSRDEHGMAYDTLRDVLVLHGGQYLLNPPSVVGGETWELAGSQWSRRAAADANTPLYLPDHRAIAYDADRHTTLLAAHPDGNVLQNPLLPVTFFEWSAGAWMRKPTSPPWRSFAAMAYDPVRKATVLAGGDDACIPHVATTCSLSDTWEWQYFQYDPTCGAIACGDGIVDAPVEQCDPAIDPCCTDGCTRKPAGTYCGGGGGSCVAVCHDDGSCACPPPVCGNGILESGEACDDGPTMGGCCSAQCQIAVSDACGNPCHAATCGTNPSDFTPVCIDHGPLVGCSPETSAIGFLSDGGTLATPDGSVTLTIPPGVAAPRTYAITSGLPGSEFDVGRPGTRVLVAVLRPAGATFADPGALVTFAWHDDDDDGIVDGTAIPEFTLSIFKDGNEITPRCNAIVAAGCTADACCDPVANTFSARVTSFSEFVVVSTPDGATTTTTSPGATTTTLPPCLTVRCAIEQALASPACAAGVPPSVGRKLDAAIGDAELAPGQTPKKAAKLYKAAKRLLAKASKAAGKASRGKHPRLSPECAATLREAVSQASARVGT
jgi:cysteine-rich repeat protein